MSRIMILGAGASRAYPNTRLDLRMHLLSDLPEIFNAERLAPEAEDFFLSRVISAFVSFQPGTRT
jgi:hypothetical protein